MLYRTADSRTASIGYLYARSGRVVARVGHFNLFELAPAAIALGENAIAGSELLAHYGNRRWDRETLCQLLETAANAERQECGFHDHKSGAECTESTADCHARLRSQCH